VDLQLPYPLVSRKHARFDCTETQCTVTDQGSANGTLINGAPIEPNSPAQFDHGDRIDIGPFEMTCEVVIKVGQPEAQPAPPPAEPAPEKPVGEKAGRASKAAGKGAAKAGPAGGKPAPAQEKPVAQQPQPQEPAAGEPPAPPPSGSGEVGLPGPDEIPAGQLPPGMTIHSQYLLQQLPGIYHTDFMSRFLGLFEATHLPLEWTVDHFELFLSAGTSPYAFLPWLANWYEIVFDSTWSEVQRRTLLKEAHQIYARRGTRWALSRVLEIYLGQAPEILEFQDAQDPYTFAIRLPVRSGQYSRELIERIIDSSKPAHTNYTLSFKS
jgi:phage tail-like protein